ncbi:MAG TPA: hypothetical protein VGD17_11050 [Chitinophagaceae bacterium]
MPNFRIIPIAIIAFIACKQPKTDTAAKGKEEVVKKEEPTEYIPVNDYIRNEIKSIDSLPVGILKRETNGGKGDSVFITPPEFKRLSAVFLPKELEKDNFQRSFTESSFFDQTTESLTFTYQANDPASSVRRVDVLASPSLQLDKIKSVYIEKSFSNADTVFNQKLYWKGGTSFTIITEKILAQKPPVIHQVKVIWDPMNY